MRVIDFKDAKCRHCYKCVRHCKVKAISIQNEQAHILKNHCINCGRCLEVCPQNAKKFASDMNRVRGYLRQGYKTIISIAPSYQGVLEFARPGQVVDALIKLGFAEVRETAEGAVLVTAEYKKMILEKKMENIITTCCPSVNDLVEKYYPACVPMLAPVVSPMIAHGRYIKKLYGNDVKVVFLGPCIAKKQEAAGDERVFGAIDAILTFEELALWLEEEGIRLDTCEDLPLGNPDPGINRMYPVSGGIIQSVVTEKESDAYHKVYVDGLANCMEMLECLQRGELKACFIEANVCEGGCAKGPASARWNTSYVKAKIKIQNSVSHRAAGELPSMSSQELAKKFRDRHLTDLVPTEAEIREILKSTGKYSVDDELNCGACGYPTCRDKAIAVYQNKAELSMCMPYALARAESMSNVILDATPNMVLVVDSNMQIVECNNKALRFLDVGREEAVQRFIFEFIEAGDIEETLHTRKSIIHKKLQLKNENMIVEETIVYIESLDSALVTFQDVTEEERLKDQRFEKKVEIVEMAQKVIEKQMLAAQEIAGLLGETTAETKVTLTKLSDSILNEG
ncbi:[Fe-Fe] hydrogenase large subunit C-terminal domain-containing protein [Clostridium sp. C105KSO13]|uniref:[Fe-Fe] hydrogenase large subunit C-terminal domain-containing protein n=1 Tax=Clostridium sp. C105KSO13 TaxID=1776045 RepID=UPI00074086BD|nr:[Fe-Fe] hydrogenase large subunit C-terminal domain-containing protein [Clostridium sp. C105KSO13]CUX43043.1 Periplasmic [Fe] hydrogenase large subunit [Clostridium sp. C105KSO13]